MQCVILAGGLATRMRPITETIPKALIPIDERPFVDLQLGWLSSHGVTDVLLSIGYLGSMIREHVGDGSRWGLKVRYVDEGQELRGTAGALRLAFDQGMLEEQFLVTYGDSFLPVDFSEVWKIFQECGSPALMTVFRNGGRWDTSNVIYEPGRVVLYDKLRRGSEASRMDYIDYGLSAMRRSVIETKVPAPVPGVKADLADLFYGLSRDGLLAGFEVQERFYEVGSPEGLRDFQEWVQKRGNSDLGG